MELKSLASLSKRLETGAGQVSHSGTTGGARVQLQLVQELEAALTSIEIDTSALKQASHGIMTSLLRMLENGLPGPVRVLLIATRGLVFCARSFIVSLLQIRASVLRCLHVIFSADPIRATLAHGQVSEFLQVQAKAYTQAGSTAVVGMLEVLALHACMYVPSHPIHNSVNNYVNNYVNKVSCLRLEHWSATQVTMCHVSGR